MYVLRKNGRLLEVGDAGVVHDFITNVSITRVEGDVRLGEDRAGNTYELRELPDVIEYEASR